MMFVAWQALALVAMCLVVLIIALAAARVAAVVWMRTAADVQEMRRRHYWGEGRLRRGQRIEDERAADD